MTGKFNTGMLNLSNKNINIEELSYLSQFTPSNTSKGNEFVMLQGPVQPKPPSFFEQAYQGKEDYRKLARTRSANRPYSAYYQDDAKSYMSHQKLKGVEDKKKTLDPHNYSRTKKIKKHRPKKMDEEEEWERFNEEVSYKSGFSRRSHNSQTGRFSKRLRSAVGGSRTKNPEAGQVNGANPVQPVLTQKNLRDFEERLSSQAAQSNMSGKGKDQLVLNNKDNINPDFAKDQELNADQLAECEGEEIKDEQDNPNEAEQENNNLPEE